MDRRSQRKASEQQAQYEQYEQQQAPPQQQQAAPAAPPAGDDLVSKLQELGRLHQSGVLSDEEFAAAKARLLS